jgi:hypothetical protein
MTMRNVALYIILSPFDNEQSDLIQRILKEKTLEEIPVYKNLLEQFVNMELIDQVRMWTKRNTLDKSARTKLKPVRAVTFWLYISSVFKKRERIKFAYFSRDSFQIQRRFL